MVQVRKDLIDNMLALVGEYLNSQEHWITVKPHGDDSKGTHLLVKGGESNKEAIDRKFGKLKIEIGKVYKIHKESYKRHLTIRWRIVESAGTE